MHSPRDQVLAISRRTSSLLNIEVSHHSHRAGEATPQVLASCAMLRRRPRWPPETAPFVMPTMLGSFAIIGPAAAALVSAARYRRKREIKVALSSAATIGVTRSNGTHASTTDPQARLYRKGQRKGKEAKLSYIGNALTENRHALVVQAELGPATGTIECSRNEFSCQLLFTCRRSQVETRQC